jgi:hypothetical protein
MASIATLGSAVGTGMAALSAGLVAAAALGTAAGAGATGSAAAAGGAGVALASGGIVTGPTYALVGEGRYDEAVIPLDKDRLAALGLGGGSGATITQNIYGDINRDVDYDRLHSDMGAAVASALRG